MNRKVLLMILDGWGEGRHDYSNAIWTQGTPVIDSLRAKYPHSSLQACGEYVGLPDGQMGNSEVGHMNLGAGRVVYQDLVKINMACRGHKLLDNLFYRSFAHGARSGSGLGHGHADDIAIQRALRFTGLDMNISFQSFNDDIEGAFTRHLHLSFVFRNGFFLFFVFFEIFVYPITAFTSFCVHNNEIK